MQGETLPCLKTRVIAHLQVNPGVIHCSVTNYTVDQKKKVDFLHLLQRNDSHHASQFGMVIYGVIFSDEKTIALTIILVLDILVAAFFVFVLLFLVLVNIFTRSFVFEFRFPSRNRASVSLESMALTFLYDLIESEILPRVHSSFRGLG